MEWPGTESNCACPAWVTRLLSRPGHRCGPDHSEGVASRCLGRPSTHEDEELASAPRVWANPAVSGLSCGRGPSAGTGHAWRHRSRGLVQEAVGARRRRPATPREAPRPSSSDQYPFQENTLLQREERSSLQPRRQAAVISFLCRLFTRRDSVCLSPCLARAKTFRTHREEKSALKGHLEKEEREEAERKGEARLAEGHQGVCAVRTRSAKNEFRSGRGLTPKNSPGVGIRARGCPGESRAEGGGSGRRGVLWRAGPGLRCVRARRL
ncbi:hypothetical protein NN561_001509 [Cricetulus griseus]